MAAEGGSGDDGSGAEAKAGGHRGDGVWRHDGGRTRGGAAGVRETFKQKTPDETCQDLCFTVHDVWARKLFMAMLRKARLEPFRTRGQRRTTIMVHGRRSLIELIWKEFLEANRTLTEYLAEVTNRVIRESLGEIKEDEARERPALAAGNP